jgi:aminoglycoside phosphotransferase
MRAFLAEARASRHAARTGDQLAAQSGDRVVFGPPLASRPRESAEGNTAATAKLPDHVFEEQVLQRLGEVLRKTAPQAELQVKAVRRQRESVLYECSLSSAAGSQSVFVKIFGNGNEAKIQFETLQKLWPLFSGHGSDLAVPQPLAFLPEFSALAMEEIPGSNLLESLRNLRWGRLRRENWAQVVGAVRNSGKWLRRFHDCDRQAEDRCLDIPAIMEGARKEVEESQQFGMTADFLAEVLDKTHSTLSGFADMPVRTPLVHGDFKLDNIIVSDSTVTGVDITMGQSGPIHRDLSSFCNSLELLRLNPFNVCYSKARIAALQHEFLSAYFEGQPYSRELVGAFQVVGLLAKYIYLCRQHRHPFLHRFYLTPFFTRRLRNITCGNFSAKPSKRSIP